jgi:hypothetical protein
MEDRPITRVWIPDDVLDRLMQEEGEVAIPTDR